MRLYVTVWQGDESGARQYKFTGTQSDQRREKKAAEAAGYTIVRNEEVEVPTVKERLLKFLNDFEMTP